MKNNKALIKSISSILLVMGSVLIVEVFIGWYEKVFGIETKTRFIIGLILLILSLIGQKQCNCTLYKFFSDFALVGASILLVQSFLDWYFQNFGVSLRLEFIFGLILIYISYILVKKN